MEKKYMETLLAQIREKRAREYVRQEVKTHLEEQKESYLAEGLPEDQAEEKAVADMGDPVKTGTALDLIHKPKPAWGMLALIALLCAAGVILQYAIQMSRASGQTDSYYLRKQCWHAAAGFLILCGIYLMDYTRIAKYSRQICTGILLLLFIVRFYGIQQVQDAPYWLTCIQFRVIHIHISSSMLFYLYVPLYAAMLHSYRNCKKTDLWKVLLYTVLPVFLSLQTASLPVTLNLTLILGILLAAAVVKGWFQMPSVRFRFTAACIIPAGILLSFLCFLLPLKSYQAERIKAWLAPGYKRDGAGYVSSVIRNILNASQLIGKNSAHQIDGYLPDYPSDYILTYLIGEFGVLAAAALIILVFMLGAKLLHISIHQRNQLGMIMGLGCSLVFGFQAAEYILVNLSLLPPTGIYFPLLSFGGSGMIQTCILLGILLSIYRYENVIPEPSAKSSRNLLQ